MSPSSFLPLLLLLPLSLCNKTLGDPRIGSISASNSSDFAHIQISPPRPQVRPLIMPIDPSMHIKPFFPSNETFLVDPIPFNETGHPRPQIMPLPYVPREENGTMHILPYLPDEGAVHIMPYPYVPEEPLADPVSSPNDSVPVAQFVKNFQKTWKNFVKKTDSLFNHVLGKLEKSH